jgi:hypothetical protein
MFEISTRPVVSLRLSKDRFPPLPATLAAIGEWRLLGHFPPIDPCRGNDARISRILQMPIVTATERGHCLGAVN